MTPDQIIARGHQAELLKKNDTLNTIFEEVLLDCSKQFLASKPLQYDERTELYLQAHAINLLRGKLQQWIDAAVIEAAKLETQKRRAKEI